MSNHSRDLLVDAIETIVAVAFRIVAGVAIVIVLACMLIVARE